jgi:hypothetical protein
MQMVMTKHGTTRVSVLNEILRNQTRKKNTTSKVLRAFPTFYLYHETAPKYLNT